LACKRLNVPPTYFFEGYEGPAADMEFTQPGNGITPDFEDRTSRLAVDRLIDKIMERIKDERTRG
jgi:hypothetical protein